MPFGAGFLCGAVITAAVAFLVASLRIRRREREALRDELTGLANRRALVDELRLASEEGGAFVHLDLDRFRSLSDSLGYEAGREVLRVAAARLAALAAEEEVLAARLGGDEFGLLARGPGRAEAAERLAIRARDALRQPLIIRGRAVVVTASAGVARLPRDGRDVDDVLAAARIALVRAKSAGSEGLENVTGSMRLGSGESHEMEQELRRAVDAGQMELWYQPVAESVSGAVLGLEALLRWRHPDRGVIAPDAFMRLAEEARLSETIGSWALNEACQALRRWSDAGFGKIYVAVNVSASQLRSPGFLAAVEGALADSEVSVDRLALEITETVATSSLSHLPGLFSALATRGIRLALDDFGTGYASLTDLTRLPVHALKLDRSIVAGVGASPRADAVCRAMIALADSLGLTVVAEGVESRLQAEALGRIGRPALQGYLVAPPMPEQEVAAFLSSRAVDSSAA